MMSAYRLEAYRLLVLSDFELRLCRLSTYGGQDFPERDHDKVALEHVWMRDGEPGSGNGLIAIQKQVYVDGAVVIDAVFRLRLASQFALYLLGFPQALERSECGLHHHGCVQEGICAFEAPGFGLDEGRNTLHRTNPLANEHDGTAQHLGSVTEIGAER